jgi:nitroreductase
MSQPESEKTMLDLIKKRRSIRSYTPEPVSDADIRSMLEAAMAAPSANGACPWEVVVVRRDDQRRAICQVHPWAGMCGSAPVVFVILGDPARSAHWVEDCSALTENLLLAATGLDLGAVWVAIYPEPQDEERVRRILSIPNRLRVLCLVPVGHPAETKPAHTKYDERCVHFDRYQE